ncbi:MAG: NAD-dependent malic enzyme [Candidatus Dormibacteria bacterium]
MQQHTSASFAFTARCRLLNRPGTLGVLTTALGSLGGDLRAIDIVRVERDAIIRDVTVLAADANHAEQLVQALHHLDGVTVLEYSDRTFLAHLGGKISVEPKLPVKTRDDLSMVYTPGVARVCLAIAEQPERARNLTIKRNTVAIVTDGTAVLGLGDIGPLAALPVMEGKAMLFKEFGAVDAFPICLNTTDVDEIVATVERISPVFGGINLEDISGPRCFEVERRLSESLDIPVFHDDQHGTAVVVMAALTNALRVVDKQLDEVRIVVLGTGAAGTACTRLLLAAGVRDIVGVDRLGILHENDNTPGEAHRWYLQHTNPRRIRGALAEALDGADVFLGTSAGGLLTRELVARMADRAIVFALANPDPEINPADAEGLIAVMATGRSDYPNQINNVLCFPGFFRGLLDCGARQVTDGMKLAAARAIADIVAGESLQAEYIVPSVFNRSVAPAVAAAVSAEAKRAGLAKARPAMQDPLHHTDP